MQWDWMVEKLRHSSDSDTSWIPQERTSHHWSVLGFLVNYSSAQNFNGMVSALQLTFEPPNYVKGTTTVASK